MVSGLELNSFVESLNILLQDVAESLAPQDIFPKLILGGPCSDSFSLPFHLLLEDDQAWAT